MIAIIRFEPLIEINYLKHYHTNWKLVRSDTREKIITYFKDTVPQQYMSYDE